VAAALYTNADTNEWSEKLGHGSWWRRGSDLPTDEEIKRAKAISTAKVSDMSNPPDIYTQADILSLEKRRNYKIA
jgi:hypothetical protein